MELDVELWGPAGVRVLALFAGGFLGAFPPGPVFFHRLAPAGPFGGREFRFSSRLRRRRRFHFAARASQLGFDVCDLALDPVLLTAESVQGELEKSVTLNWHFS